MTDAEEILSEFQQTQEPASESQAEEPQAEEPQSEPETQAETQPEVETQPVETQAESQTEVETQSESQTETQLQSEPESQPQTESHEQPKTDEQDDESNQRHIIFIGVKPIMTYVNVTLTQLANQPTVTIKARGRRITQAVDISQMIVKRMDTVGYEINNVRISSDSLTSQDGKQRNVSTIEIDITKN